MKMLHWGVFFALLSLPCSAFSSHLESELKRISLHKNFFLEFKQEFYSSLREKISYSEGLLYVQSPSSFRFELSKPRKEVYISNGKDFWKYVPDFKHAQHLSAVGKDFQFLHILTDRSFIFQMYKVLPWENKKTTTFKETQTANLPDVESDIPPALKGSFLFVQLRPLQKQLQQKVLFLAFEKKTGCIQELRIVQINGNRTRLVFSRCLEKNIPEKIFQFKPPQGILVDEEK